MISLGIEGTAHTLGVGIVDERCNVLANRIDMLRPKEGGIHPRVAANHHADVVPGLISAALTDAKITPSQVDVVAFSRGPGLGPCLRTAATAARSLALSLDVPLVGVNHCVAHLEIGRATTPCEDPVLLYVSGANTQVIAFARGKYRVFGETLDVGLGNCLDKIGREMDLPFPAGPVIEKMALGADRLLDMPYSVKGMDVAFSGFITAAAAHARRGERVENIAGSLQEWGFAMLTEVTERALAHLEYDEVLLGGGVARNKRLRTMVQAMCEERGAKSFVPRDDLCVDNGAMIAWLGLMMKRSGVVTPIDESVVDQRFRTDDVEVTWR
ncbi:MAG: bifunctional N(6)-L-threonylcarbamoyladenine synthase/serine/threonine protein kinase [Euryarchaeota archaeon]|nr:bifunctional N(6)-L-threonylcarbamoyladenine synthase/serine/threonine protein kinase [Euryarchaeota archaeon]